MYLQDDDKNGPKEEPTLIPDEDNREEVEDEEEDKPTEPDTTEV